MSLAAPDMFQTREDLTLLAKVVVLAPMAEALDYSVPDGMELAAGDHVIVPLGHAKVRGLVIGIAREEASGFALKPVQARLDDAPVPEVSLNFWLWAANWTLTPPGVFINGCLRALKNPRAQTRYGYVVSGEAPARMTKARQRVLGSGHPADVADRTGLCRRGVAGRGNGPGKGRRAHQARDARR